jgi:hypothetical protein
MYLNDIIRTLDAGQWCRVGSGRIITLKKATAVDCFGCAVAYYETNDTGMGACRLCYCESIGGEVVRSPLGIYGSFEEAAGAAYSHALDCVVDAKGNQPLLLSDCVTLDF